MNTNKIKTYIGFAIKSRKIIFGYDNIITYKKNQHLILVSSTVNDKVKNKITLFAEKNNIKVVNLLDITVEELTDRENSKIISIIDESLSSAIINQLEC